MIKYILITLLLFSQIEGQQIIHTETWESGRIKSLSYHKMVDRGNGIELIKKVLYSNRNGRKYGEENYKDGKKKLYTEWYENGQKKFEENYKDGEFDGLQTYWYENGQKRREGNMKDGKRDGLVTDWYENGQKGLEQTYKDGKEDGLMTRWYENGQKEKEGTFKDGNLISEKKWNEDGSVRK